MNKNDRLQGTLALLVLKTLARGPMHGYGMALHIQLISKHLLRVKDGSLYPALHRMEQHGWVSAEWGISKNGRRARYYRLTARGRKQLAEREKNWERITQAVAHVLQFACETERKVPYVLDRTVAKRVKTRSLGQRPRGRTASWYYIR